MKHGGQLAFPGDRCMKEMMDILRRSLILLMLSALLPWGAYSASFTAADLSDLAAAPVADAGELVASVKRKCRTATLPGSPCGPDLAEQPCTTAIYAPAIACAVHRRDVWSAAEQAQSPPTGPPRLS